MKASAMNGTAPARRKRRPGSRPGGPSMGRSDRRILFRMIPPLPGYTQFVILQSSCSGYCDQPEPLPASPYRIWARRFLFVPAQECIEDISGSSRKVRENHMGGVRALRSAPRAFRSSRTNRKALRCARRRIPSSAGFPWLNVKNLSLQKNGDYRLNRPSSVS